MEALSIQSFADALTRCHDNHHYMVCVVFGSTVTYIPFINELRRRCSTTSIPGVAAVYVRNDNARIMFLNGSCVDMFVLNESQHGRRCHEMLYDDGLNVDANRYILAPMLVPYRNLKDSSEDVFDEAEELDEFLNGFRIVDNEWKTFTTKH